MWVLEGDSGYWKGIVGTGRVRFWVQVGGFWVWCPSARSRTATSGGEKGDCGYWKGVVGKKGDKKEGFGVLEGDCG